jgi:hypothetical protein
VWKGFSMALQTRRMISSLGVACVLAVGLASCSSDANSTTEVAAAEAETTLDFTTEDIVETDATETVATETEAVETEAVPTEATETEAAVGSLAPDSPTCTAFAKVKELNDRSGALTAEFQTQIVSGASESPEKAAEAWKDFQTKFAADSEVVLPQLKDAYATLAKEQPQYAKDFANLDEVTGDLLKFFTTISYDDLDKLESKLAEAVSTEKTLAAGQSSLKIDKFSKSACGIAFANT